MFSLLVSLIITTTVMTCHPISCEQAEDYHVPEWVDVTDMAGILQGEVGHIPTAYDFVAEQLVADALDYHVINKPLSSRWYAWATPTSRTILAIKRAWYRVVERGYKLGVPRCGYIGSERDAATWGFKLTDAPWSRQNGKYAVYAFNCG
jgi:hypothetical protein